MKITGFWDVTSCLLVYKYQRLEKNLMPPSFTLKKKAADVSTMFVPIYQIALHHAPV